MPGIVPSDGYWMLGFVPRLGLCVGMFLHGRSISWVECSVGAVQSTAAKVLNKYDAWESDVGESLILGACLRQKLLICPTVYVFVLMYQPKVDYALATTSEAFSAVMCGLLQDNVGLSAENVSFLMALVAVAFLVIWSIYCTCSLYEFEIIINDRTTTTYNK